MTTLAAPASWGAGALIGDRAAGLAVPASWGAAARAAGERRRPRFAHPSARAAQPVVETSSASVATIRRSARTLHATCAELLDGYAVASREQWRQALLTAGCLDPHPRRSPGRRAAPALVVEGVVQPSDVLCALWLARRTGLFAPGSPCGDVVGLRSACDIVPEFAPTLRGEQRTGVLEALRANAAWRAHMQARAAA